MSEPKYPHVRANLSRADGNPFIILKVVSHALRNAGVSVDEVKQYGEESVAADFDELASVAGRWVTVQ